MKSLVVTLLLLGLISCAHKVENTVFASLSSPDGVICVKVYISPTHRLVYRVTRYGRPVILESSLGLQLEHADFSGSVSIVGQTKVMNIHNDYKMITGKKSAIHYNANEQTFFVANDNGEKLNVVFRLSNDGVSFRYEVKSKNPSKKKFIKEVSGFHFPPTTRAWLQPIAPAQTGWSNTNPSYEENYLQDILVGTPSSMGAGWVFPALFRTGDTWVVISEAGMDGSWHASRLAHNSSDGKYTLDVPQKPEVFTAAELLAQSEGDLISPWRIIALGDLSTIMESTLGTDVVEPAITLDPKVVKPGHSSWSWALLKDDSTVFEVQKRFIDYAADMHWDYTLIDADWHKKIGYKRMAELVHYATKKNVGILLWYNSSGDWNTTPQGPKSELLTHEQRSTHFSRLQAMGVKGVKVDFFAGDGRSMIAYYIDILKDAAAHNLLVNFHGSTLPRGLQRTYPNLMTAEAIKGLEFTTFSQEDENQVASHAVMAIFTRNLFDPMDFTPMVFGEIPNIKRTTENSFELAESVLFLSGIQHFAEIPAGMAAVPVYVKTFLQDLPAQWDEVKFINGYPGRYVVIARRSGSTWYIAGINGDDKDQFLSLDLSFTGKEKALLIESGIHERSFVQSDIDASSLLSLNLRPRSGFVVVAK